MTTGYKINGVDWDDLFIRRDKFTQGGLWVWGQNVNGNLGDGTSSSRSSPVQTLSGGSDWVYIGAAGGIKSDGSLWNWGSNLIGYLGDGTNGNRKSSPVQTVAGGTNWKLITKASTATAAIKQDGSLWTWGLNGSGQLGDSTSTSRSSPVQTVAGGTNWKKASVGFSNFAAIKTDGTLWAWGHNTDGTLGDGTTTFRSSPVQNIAGGNNWKIVSGTPGRVFLSVKTDGTLWTWGRNAYGQLGDNTLTHRSSPVQTVAGGTNWRAVAGGFYHSAGIKTDGTLWTWGNNTDITITKFGGMLGDNTTVHRSSPVQTIAGGNNWKMVSCGNQATAAIKTDGTLWTWGSNYFGELGIGTKSVGRSSPAQTISGGSNWKTITSEGDNAFYAIIEDYF